MDQSHPDLLHEAVAFGQPGPQVLLDLTDLLLLVRWRNDAAVVVVVVAAAAAVVELVDSGLLPGLASQSSSWKKLFDDLLVLLSFISTPASHLRMIDTKQL